MSGRGEKEIKKSIFFTCNHDTNVLKGDIMVQKIIVRLSEEDRLNNHVPNWVFKLCHRNDVFFEDFKTRELVQVLDFSTFNKISQTKKKDNYA